jgi:hypothetical protein
MVLDRDRNKTIKNFEESTEDEAAETPSDELLSDDFYMENGFMVFTASYHRRRGFCCSSGCRHCPYKK